MSTPLSHDARLRLLASLFQPTTVATTPDRERIVWALATPLPRARTLHDSLDLVAQRRPRRRLPGAGAARSTAERNFHLETLYATLRRVAPEVAVDGDGRLETTWQFQPDAVLMGPTLFAALARVRPYVAPTRILGLGRNVKRDWFLLLHSALRKCCDSTASALAWNVFHQLDADDRAWVVNVSRTACEQRRYATLEEMAAACAAAFKDDCGYVGRPQRAAVYLAFQLMNAHDWANLLSFVVRFPARG